MKVNDDCRMEHAGPGTRMILANVDAGDPKRKWPIIEVRLSAGSVPTPDEEALCQEIARRWNRIRAAGEPAFPAMTDPVALAVQDCLREAGRAIGAISEEFHARGRVEAGKIWGTNYFRLCRALQQAEWAMDPRCRAWKNANGNTWHWNEAGMGLGKPLERGDSLENGTSNFVEMRPSEMADLEEVAP